MNPIAQALNKDIADEAPSLFDSLSPLGQEIYFPKGIISQSNEAKLHATKFNATIGIAESHHQPMVFSNASDCFTGFKPEDIFPYAPTSGRKKLRELWKQEIEKKNPSLLGKSISLPFVTGGITHGLSLFADMFLGKDDLVLIPDQFWGNYRLSFSVIRGAKLETYKFYTEDFKLNLDSLDEALSNSLKTRKKITLLFNYPNNPTGYTCTKEEAERTVSILLRYAETGAKIVVACDDAYFGLFFDHCHKESIFSLLAGVHENIIAVKLDGATKELFYWGARVGFLTVSAQAKDSSKVYGALENKLMGLVRGNMSNLNHHAQTVVEKLLADPQTAKESEKSLDKLKSRAEKIKQIHANGQYDKYWTPYPFNSGYFMCVRLKNGIDSEKLRLHLLHKYQTGVIATAPTDIRVAFSCLDFEDIQACFDNIAQAFQDLANQK